MAPKPQERTVHPDPAQFALDPAKSGQVPPVMDEPEDDGSAAPAGPTPAEKAAEARALAAERTTQQLVESVTRLAQPRAVEAPKPAQPEVTLDLTGLPNPEEDSAGFLKGLGERIGTTVGQASARATQRATEQASALVQRQQALDSTWARFREEHADIAQHGDLVEAAAKRVADRLRGRGIDTEQYLTTNQDDFLNDLAAETTKTLNKIKGLNEDGTDPAANEDDGRDAGVIPDRSGGTGRGRKPAKETPALFTDELKAVQRGLKLF